MEIPIKRVGEVESETDKASRRKRRPDEEEDESKIKKRGRPSIIPNRPKFSGGLVFSNKPFVDEIAMQRGRIFSVVVTATPEIIAKVCKRVETTAGVGIHTLPLGDFTIFSIKHGRAEAEIRAQHKLSEIYEHLGSDGCIIDLANLGHCNLT